MDWLFGLEAMELSNKEVVLYFFCTFYILILY